MPLKRGECNAMMRAIEVDPHATGWLRMWEAARRATHDGRGNADDELSILYVGQVHTFGRTRFGEEDHGHDGISGWSTHCGCYSSRCAASPSWSFADTGRPRACRHRRRHPAGHIHSCRPHALPVQGHAEEDNRRTKIHTRECVMCSFQSGGVKPLNAPEKEE